MDRFKTVESLWVVEKSTTLAELAIREGASVQAPPGKKVTMTINGIGTKLQPGTYQGDIALTVTDDIIVPFFAYSEPMEYRTAVCIKDGKYIPEQSVAAAVKSGQVSDGECRDILIKNRDEAFNGIYVTGNGEYTINDANIDMVGIGGNDFNGYGAAIMTHGNSKVTVNRGNIHVRGASRNAVFVGDHSTAYINDSVISTEAGVLPHDYKDNVDMGGMMRVPWQLSLRGNNRATNLADYGTAYYNNCHLMSEGWGVLSTDAVDHCRMYAKDCTIEITGSSGYGSFTIGDCFNSFDGCTFNVPDYALVMANETAGGEFVNGTVVNSGRNAVMFFLNQGGLLHMADSTFNTEKAIFNVKGCAPHIKAEHCRLNAANGIIMSLIDNDDPTNPSGWYIEPEGPDVYVDGRDLTTSELGKDVIASFRDMEIIGDFFNATTCMEIDKSGFPPYEMPSMPVPEGEEPPVMPGPSAVNMDLTFESVRLVGVISAASGKHHISRIDKFNCEELGEVDFTPCEAINNGVIVRLGTGSSWTVTGTCYLTTLTLDENAVIWGIEGTRVRMTVDGAETDIVPGTYKGKIILSIK